MSKRIKIPRRLNPRIAPTRFCYGLENKYHVYFTSIVKKHEERANILFKTHVVPAYEATYLKQDSAGDNNDPGGDRLEQALKYFDDMISYGVNAYDIETWVTKFITALDRFSYSNCKVQFAPQGINPIDSDIFLRQYIQAKIAENVARIVNSTTQYDEQIESVIYNGVTKGTSTNGMAKQIAEVDERFESHANLIARDQTGSMLGQINAHRQTEAGASYYIWQSMEDAGVRPAHQELDQTLQKFGDPDGGDGGQLPGEPIKCRCVALPVFPDELKQYESDGLI